MSIRAISSGNCVSPKGLFVSPPGRLEALPYFVAAQRSKAMRRLRLDTSSLLKMA